MEDLIKEGREEGREQERIFMILALLETYSEEDLIYSKGFRGLHITQEEIDAAKAWDDDSGDGGGCPPVD